MTKYLSVGSIDADDIVADVKFQARHFLDVYPGQYLIHDLEELTYGSPVDVIQEYMPPFTYIGVNGENEFGIWPDIERLQFEIEDGEVSAVEDLSDLPANHVGLVALGNDHGNLTLGRYDGYTDIFTEYWSVV